VSQAARSLPVYCMCNITHSWHTFMCCFIWLTNSRLPYRTLTSLQIGSRVITTLPSLPAQLQRLNVSSCEHLQSLPVLPTTLQTLCCDSCDALIALPSSLSSTALTELGCDGCVSLQRLPDLPESLTELNAQSCRALTEV
jgi:hypothetical protein